MCDMKQCGACPAEVHEDELEYLNGEMLHVCPACKKLSRECEDCGKGYLTVEGLADGCGEEDAMIHKDKQGRWICDDCRQGRKSAAKWEHVNHEIDRAIERKHGHEI